MHNTHKETEEEFIPITPVGQQLKELYLDEMGISPSQLANAIGISKQMINQIIQGKRHITPEISVKLGAFFEQSPGFWLALQAHIDLRIARQLNPDEQSEALLSPDELSELLDQAPEELSDIDKDAFIDEMNASRGKFNKEYYGTNFADKG